MNATHSFVKASTGATMVLEVSLSDQVSKVKKMVEDKCGILSEQQILLVGYRKIMTNNSLLSDYNIKDGCQLDVSLRVKGGSSFKMYETIFISHLLCRSNFAFIKVNCGVNL